MFESIQFSLSRLTIWSNSIEKLRTNLARFVYHFWSDRDNHGLTKSLIIDQKFNRKYPTATVQGSSKTTGCLEGGE